VTRGTSGLLAALAIVVACTQCTGGQSGHEGSGLDRPADGPDGGHFGGAGGSGGVSGSVGFGGSGSGGGSGQGPWNVGNSGAGGSGHGCVVGTGGAGGVLGGGAADQDAGADTASDGGTVPCPVYEPVDEPASSGTPRNRAPLGSAHVCGPSTVEAPLDCFDVCGALVTCDGAIACDVCLERCNDSRQAPPSHGIRCLSLAIYWIDEEGCERMVQEYEAYTEAFDCGG